MTMLSQKIKQIIVSCTAASSILLSQLGIAAPQGAGDVSDRPLFLVQTEKPNVMLLLDTTGSMNFLLDGTNVDDKYDGYGNQRADYVEDYPYRPSLSDKTSLKLEAFENPRRLTVLQNVLLGTEELTNYCTNVAAPTDGGLSCSDYNKTKVGLIEGGVFDQMNLGMAFFSSHYSTPKIRIKENIQPFEDAEKTIVDAVDTIKPYGATPLANALQAMGHYFSEAGQLTLHPDGPGKDDKDREIVFHTKPMGTTSETVYFDTGNLSPYQQDNDQVTFTSVADTFQIQSDRWCASNHVIMLTDGEPTADKINTSSGLVDYDGDGDEILKSCNFFGCKEIPINQGNTDILDDVSLALYDMDLVPSVEEGKQNVMTHVIAFGKGATAAETLLKSATAHSGGVYKTAQNASELKTAIELIAKRALATPASSASITLNNSVLSNGSKLFVSRYTTGIWTGDVLAMKIDDKTGDVIESCVGTDTECWSAKTSIESINVSSRNVFTLASTGDGIAFTAANVSKFNQSIQDDLGKFSGDAKDVVNYIRGDRSKEDDITFRTRTSLLGDIINSEPTYDDRKTPNDLTDDVIYVGANDGMMHALSADNGQELFAYIPAGVASTESTKGLHYYASAQYDHAALVDMTPVIATTNSGKRILVGGYGAGGKGLYALDITSPRSFGASDVLWELTASDVADDILGYNLSAPIIGEFDGQKVAIFGNGYQSGSGEAKLLVVNLSGPASTGWVKGTNYHVIDAGAGGLSGATAFFKPGTDVIQQVYAGNLDGEMYRFFKDSKGSTGSVIFDAGSNQPITAKPAVKQNTDLKESLIDEYTVYFGTGAYFAENDASNTDAQSFYAVIDKGGVEVEQDKLQEVIMTTIAGVTIKNPRPGGETVQRDSRITTTSKTVPTDDAGVAIDPLGWFVNLPAKAERMVLEPGLLEGHIIFATTIPEDTATTPCSDGGKGFIMVLQDDTGLSPQDRPVFDLSDNFVVGDRPDDYALVTSSTPIPDGVDKKDLIPEGQAENRVIPGGYVINGIPTSPRYLANKANEESGSKVYYMYVNASRDADFKLFDFGGLVLKRHSWKQLQ